MGTRSMKTQDIGGDGHTFDVGGSGLRGVEHQCDIAFRDITGIQHIDLAAERFLCGRAIDSKCKGQIVCQLFQSNSGSGQSRTLHVMAASMTDPFQRIIFNQQAEIRAAAAVVINGLKSRIKSGNSLLNNETVLFQVAAQKLRCLILLSIKLGVVENKIRHGAELVDD